MIRLTRFVRSQNMALRLGALAIIASIGAAALWLVAPGTKPAPLPEALIALGATWLCALTFCEILKAPDQPHSLAVTQGPRHEPLGSGQEPATAPAPTKDDQSQADEIIRLKESACRDPLTGLLNRASFRREVERCLLKADDGATRWLMFVDLNGFKEINDQNGHDCGDKVLKACARRLQLSVQMIIQGSSYEAAESVFLSRFGGDEFVIFVDADVDASLIERVVKRILKVLACDITHNNRLIALTASTGIAAAPLHGTRFDDLIKAADSAMYAAKASPTHKYVFYDEELDLETRKIAKLETELHIALAQEQLEFVFQPIFDLRTSQMVSAEALVRWNHPDGETLRPAEFFDVLERTHLVTSFNEWCVAKVISYVGELHRRGLPLMIAANVAPQQLASLEYISLIRTHLQRSDCPPELLQIEVTEDAAMREPALTVQNLHKLHDIGVTLAIDDFGVGYSNLARLTELPLSRLKIDRSLLTSMDRKPSAFVLMQSIINLSNSLGFHSVVEGIETDEQLAMVSAMGADLGQGFLLSKPISFEQLVSLIEARALINPPEKSASAQHTQAVAAQ
ncbi:bifunctional diguanylate cyclase/phosphodiesterase [Qipengyuania sp. S6317L1]|uniref:putative bifunctional diguanylate cyclase/phosphodiesterase n=1 Tax=Qipengyuania sp. S6317L1 TaxID=2926410 RepID=UPI001FF0FD65|nr:bifunctional diguanylate cyclase/phosphodiesterase [Qipengyuania sp. S6317L1]